MPSFATVLDAIAWYARTGGPLDQVVPPLDATGHATVDPYMATIFAGLMMMPRVAAVRHLEAKAQERDRQLTDIAGRTYPVGDAWHGLRAAAMEEQQVLARILRKWAAEIEHELVAA